MPVCLCAQSELCIGRSDTAYSAALNEMRTYLLHLPPGYNDSPDASYPVIYLLDGDLFFHALVALQHSYAGGRQPLMPACIIVGILNTDRTRDLTPTKSAYRRDGKLYDGDRALGGGSEAFTDYLGRELRSAINAAYRTNGKNIIVGHSFGGLFVLATLFRHPELFDACVALDPSFWWDNGLIARMAEELRPVPSFAGKKLYVGVATQMRRDSINIHWQIADDFRSRLIPAAIANGLDAKWKDFGEESHGTIPIPGMADAFKTLFK
ncbi:MAG: prolyl oligopeptidase family serine peptidase [Tannerellaceae bacterium]|nr:prolyl oligopeptidase family serine peptidase [Tannerellaceae bacterium]